MREMTVTGISVDSNNGAAVLVLEDSAGMALPISIGMAEATSIAKELEGIELPRPLTHDLLKSVLEHLGAKLVRIEIIALRDSTYFAELVLHDPAGRELRVDSRPSDAIGVAVRVQAPIYVHEQVLRKALPEAQEIRPPTDKEEWRRLLEEMEPEDFGKYKM
jgi:bifunctional DNase/RNase